MRKRAACGAASSPSRATRSKSSRARRARTPSLPITRSCASSSTAPGASSEIKGDGDALDSYALEPEPLTNDAGVKTDEHETLAYTDIPPVLVRAILSIEDRRFFEHGGIDPVGLARAAVGWGDADQDAEAGRLDHHAAARQEHLPHPRAHAAPQVPRGHHRARHRAADVEGGHPRALLQRDLPRPARQPRRARRRAGGARLLRQGVERPLARRGRDRRRHDSEPRSLRARPPPRAGESPPQHRARRDAARPLDHARRGRGRRARTRRGRAGRGGGRHRPALHRLRQPPRRGASRRRRRRRRKQPARLHDDRCRVAAPGRSRPCAGSSNV